MQHAGYNKFVISEENGGQTIDNVSYDNAKFYATVVVREDQTAGKLTATVTYSKSNVDVDGAIVEVPTFTNTYTEPPTVGITVNKVWDDNDNAAGTRPTGITVHLMNGITIVDTRVLTADTNWSFTCSEFGVRQSALY